MSENSEKKVYPLKLKIIVGLSLIILIVLGTSTYYSFGLFTQDKTQYIFENGLQRAESRGDSFTRPLHDALTSLPSYLSLGGVDLNSLVGLLNSNSQIVAFSEQSKSPANFRVTTTDPEKAKIIRSWWQKVRTSQLRLPQITNYKAKEGDVYYHVVGMTISEREYIYLAFKYNNSFGFILLDYSQLVDELKSDGVFQYSILDQKGLSFFTKTKPEASDLFDPIVKDKAVKSSKEVWDKKKEKYLISYVRYQDQGFTFLSLIEGKKAFEVIDGLFYRTLYFGIALLGLALIIGVWFSNKLTKPLSQLVEATKLISNKDFSKRVEVESNDEMRVLGEGFNYMSEELEGLIEQLEEYNRTLEQKVEERTAELKSANDFISAMINSIDQGLFVLDRDLNVAGPYTKACSEMFGNDLQGLSFKDILGMDEGEFSKVQKWADVLFSGKLPFSSAVGLGPKSFTTNDDVKSDDYKYIEFSYYQMQQDNEGSEESDELENIVTVATDKTAQRRAEEAFTEKEAYVEMIIKLIKGKTQFFNFLEEVESILWNINLALQEEVPNLDFILMNYHSLNGGFGIYHVSQLQRHARSCEQYIVDHKQDGDHNYENFKIQLREQLDEFISHYRDFVKEISSIFSTQQHVVEIDKADLSQFKSMIEEFVIRHEDESFLLDEYRHTFEMVAVEQLVQPFAQLIDELAGKLSKTIHPMKVVGGDLKVKPGELKEFFGVMVHLVRNCVDHGIESSQAREEAGKDIYGTIAFEFEANDDQIFSLVVSDDGGGIDPDRIRMKWNELHPYLDITSLTDEEVIYKIFDPQFSTAEQLTEVSGRGVGMSAIKDIVDKCGGSLVVESVVGEGSRFIFHLPFRMF